MQVCDCGARTTVSFYVEQYYSKAKHTCSTNVLRVLRGHVDLSSGKARHCRLLQRRIAGVFAANHTVHHDLPPAPHDVVLGGVDERVQTAIAVGEHREEQLKRGESLN